MGLRVIGTGFGRTGTDSMREALNRLGFGPCHHMYEVNAHPEQKRLWRALAKGAAPDWDALFDGYASCMDFPSCYYWRALIDTYPDARVIHTWRDTESWVASFQASVQAALTSTLDPDSVGIALIVNQVFDGRITDLEHVARVYEAHIAEVLATVPPERLLVHRIGDGWAPLCAHLGVPIPETPYPHRNTKAEFQAQHAAARAPGT